MVGLEITDTEKGRLFRDSKMSKCIGELYPICQNQHCAKRKGIKLQY